MPTAKTSVLTIGGATRDITFSTPEVNIIDNPKHDLTKQKLVTFEYGAKINIKDVHITFGGGAANSAVNFSRLGFDTSTLVCLGQDEIGESIIKNFAEHKINTALIQTSDKKKSGFSTVILTKEKPGAPGERTLFTYRGANEDLKISDLKSVISDWIYISSLSQKNWNQDLNKIIRQQQHAKIAWNPGNLQLQAGLEAIASIMKQIDVFLVNKDESIELLKSRDQKWDSNNPRNIIKALKPYINGILIITDGPKGAYSFYDHQFYFEPSKPVHETDVTGVGDAFCSTFIAGLELFNGNIEKSLKLAIKQSASVIQKYGAQMGLLTKNELL